MLGGRREAGTTGRVAPRILTTALILVSAAALGFLVGFMIGS